MNEKILFMPTKKRSKFLSETVGDLVEYLLTTTKIIPQEPEFAKTK